MISRRAFLASCAALAAGAAAAKSPPRPRGRARPYRIDVHHHFVPPALQKEGSGFPAWSPERALEDMDNAGIGTAILSLAPGALAGDDPNVRRTARDINDYAAQLRKARTGRFGMFATLPLPDRDASVRELDYALGVLRAEGVALASSYGGKAIGDETFAPLLEEINKRRAVVCVHPPGPVAGEAYEPATEAARGMQSVLFSGAATRYPDIRWIFLHAGGLAASAFAVFQRMEAELGDKAGELLPAGVRAEMQKFHFDAAGLTPESLAALLALVPSSQLLYGSDYPAGSPVDVTERLRAYKWKRNELRPVERENALQLMPRLMLVV